MMAEESGSEVFADDVVISAKEVPNNDGEYATGTSSNSSKSAIQGFLQTTTDYVGKEDDGDEEGVVLTEDIYSLMYTSGLFSPPFWYALFCNIFQYIFIFLVIVDVLSKNSDSDNRFNLPPGVPLQVTIGQGFALLLALSMQDDLLTGILYIHQGHRCSSAAEGDDKLPGANTCKWYFAAVAQLAAGAGLNFVIFVLVMQAKDIIGMFLNFAALMFISEIDDIGFKLADHGFINRSLQEACKNVRTVKLAVSKETNTSYRRTLFVLMATGLYTGYGILKFHQLNGDFLCQRIFLQFGDDFGTEYAAFSGVYVQTDKQIDQRVTYIEEKRLENQDFAGHVGYCSSEMAWTLYLDESKGPCEWVARSIESDTFDVTTTSASNWLIMNVETTQILAYSSFYLSCFDCNNISCDPGHGSCKNNICVCKSGRYGASCEFGEPCEELRVDLRSSGFSFLAGGEVHPPNSFELLQVDDEVVMVYDKPVYISKQGFLNSRYALLFTGRRYAMAVLYGSYNSTLFSLLWESPGGYHSFFESPAERRGTWWYPQVSNKDAGDHFAVGLDYEFIYLSAPMNVGTSTHKLTPEGLSWFRNRGTYEGEYDSFPNNGPVFKKGFVDAETTLLCAVCDDETNPCMNLEYCDESTKRCETCRNSGYTGALCEATLHCSEVSCREGTCDQVSGKCVCPAHTTGEFCEWEQDCNVAGCMDGGICDTGTGYCKCPEQLHQAYYEYCDWSGSCAVSGCLNDGNCTESGVCSCPPEYYGRFCEDKWDCDIIQCKVDGGSCNPAGYCDCKPYRTGRLCEKGVNCALIGCMDGGTCNEISGDCECPLDTFTPYCGFNGNCAQFGCNGVGNCTESGVCQCPESDSDDDYWFYDGAFCQERWPE